MKRYVCIHGHFYQPPRENPWLDSIEIQDSAAPYHDWNERVTAECYAPNAAARILDGNDRIRRIVNNYSRISFNFGPTLLSWLEQHDPETYAAILDADVESRERFGGHGSALAQVYNHIIMPLASERDRQTQVRWGIRDFEHRFGRRPEGMWLAETAVDVATLESLAAEGIAFTILAPHQGARSRAIGSRAWTEANGGKIDPSMPYRCTLPSGRTIVIFFYDGPVSRAVAFERLLSSGETFAHRLTSAFSPNRDWPQLAHIATDGETYGHHHRHGEMALAYALDYIEKRRIAELTNYGQFLEIHPPTHEAEIVEQSSWSCMHGIERWRSDCGCQTGGEAGWNQAWRAPLRVALDWLAGQASSVFETEGGALFRDPWQARNDYIDVVIDRSDASLNPFLARHVTRELLPEEVVRSLELLEMQRHAMLMYTSCGWFFNEVSGIETVQVLQYAARVVQLAERISGVDIETPFLERLEAVKSNLENQGSAAAIYRNRVAGSKVDLLRIGAHYAVSLLFFPQPDRSRVYRHVVERRDYRETEIGRARVTVGRISVTSEITRESEDLTFGVLYLGDVHLTGGVRRYISPEAYESLRHELVDPGASSEFPEIMRILDRHLSSLTFSIKSLFRDQQRAVVSEISRSTLVEAEAAFRQLHDRYLPFMRFHKELGLPVPRVLANAAEFDLDLRLKRMFESDELPLDAVRSLLQRAEEEGVQFDRATLSFQLRQGLERRMQRFVEHPGDVALLRDVEDAVEFVTALRLPVDLWRLQNAWYHLAQSHGPGFASLATSGTPEGDQWLNHFRALGSKLAMSLRDILDGVEMGAEESMVEKGEG